MFDAIAGTIPRVAGYTDRAHRLTVLKAVLNGTMYDELQYEFHVERNLSGEYVPLKLRKPSVRYNLCRLVVENSVAMLLGSGRFPAVHSPDANTQTALADILDESDFATAMNEAAQIGSIGSVVVRMRVLGNRVFWTVMPTMTLTPTWNPKAPSELINLTDRYQVRGETLAAQGYAIPKGGMHASYWFHREWDATYEIWYQPLLVSDAAEGKQPKVDRDNTVKHDLGFVPAVWIKNLPGGAGDDGRCTFEPAIQTQIEIEYRLSQGGRALQYSSDPLMMIRDPAGDLGVDMVRSATNAIVVGEGGDAKMLQIDGAATGAVLEFVHGLRELGIEAIHGNRHSADKMAAAQSGRAMEIMQRDLIDQVDMLRHSYGRAILRLAQMVVQTRQKYSLTAFGATIPKMDAENRLHLRWGPYFAATLHDKLMVSQELVQLHESGLMSREAAVTRVAEMEAIPDVGAELSRITLDLAERERRTAAQQARTDRAAISEEN